MTIEEFIEARLVEDEQISRDGGCYHGPDCLECNGWPPVDIDPEDSDETGDAQ